jgi:hypothetical protein
LLGYNAGTETNGGDVKTKLDDERDDEAEIAIFDVHGSEPESRPEGGEESKSNEDGKQQDLPSREKLIPDHHADQDDKTYEEVDESDDHGGGGNNEPGKIDLADEVGVVDQTSRSFREGGGKKGPRQHAGEDHQGVRRRALSGEFGNPAEDDGKNDHRQEWTDQRPSDANDGLFVTDGDIAPSEDGEQLPIMPKIAPIVFFGMAGFKNGHHGGVEKLKLGKLKVEILKTDKWTPSKRKGKLTNGVGLILLSTFQLFLRKAIFSAHATALGRCRLGADRPWDLRK